MERPDSWLDVVQQIKTEMEEKEEECAANQGSVIQGSAMGSSASQGSGLAPQPQARQLPGVQPKMLQPQTAADQKKKKKSRKKKDNARRKQMKKETKKARMTVKQRDAAKVKQQSLVDKVAKNVVERTEKKIKEAIMKEESSSQSSEPDTIDSSDL